MEVYYRREIQHNYLIIEPDEPQGWSYEVKMLLHNPIEGLLKFRMKTVDEKQQFFYEITSKQPLSRILEGRGISAEEIRMLILAIAAILKKIEPYLLSPENILLQTDYIYLEPDEFKIYFCAVPGKKTDFSKELHDLLYELLKKIDHQNQESVIVAYGLYQETQKENYGIEDLMRFLNTISSEEKDIEEKEWEYSESKESQAEHMREQVYEEKNVYYPVSKIALVCLLAWILVLMIIGGIYVTEGIHVLWQVRGILFGVLSIMVLGSLVLGFLGIRLGDDQVKKEDFQECTSGKIEGTVSDENGREKWQITYQNEEYSEKEEQEMKTEILVQEREEERYYLISLQGEYENISLAYFPFIIGKSEYMADYVLPKSSVSRMHVKIERKQEGYQITDLNSTNGTWVGEHRLEANETYPLNVNDMIRIADLVFCFHKT